MGTLLVAAGGGGDAIAAAALAALTPTRAVGIATLAWDRLMIDPLPGPRSAADFTGLQRRNDWWQVTGGSRTVAPAGSALPRLATELPIPLVLLDPTYGAYDMRQQIEAAALELGARDIRVVDVGGDLLGRSGDAGLRSPLADTLTAASCVDLPALSWIAGPGLDGELSEALVLQRARNAAVLRVDPGIWQPYLSILRWHPSEATALLASASLGMRGTVEIREAGLPVKLTAHSPTVLELDMHTVCEANPLITALTATTSFIEAEQVAVRTLGRTELDSERDKATHLEERRPRSADEVIAALPQWEAAARRRGVDFVTYRRMAEGLGFLDLAALRTLVTAQHPDRDTGLLWALGPEP